MQVAVYFLIATNPEAASMLYLFPQELASRPWTFITFQFVHPESPFWFFFSMLILWIMARPLEEDWGSARFLAFWAVSVFGAALTATLLGQPLAGDIFLDASLLFTFATVFPDTEFRIMFILPVKVKYLAIIGGAFLVFSSMQFGLLAGAVNVVGMSAGYAFFLITRNMPTRRQMAFGLKKKKANIELKVEASITERRNLEWDAKVKQAIEGAKEKHQVADEDQTLLAELDAAMDPEITVCAPGDFNFTDDRVCRTCSGYAECAARRILMSAE
jgi:membrane associated rhomboid family serine protease